MSKTTKKIEIVPFTPRRFPPRHLTRKHFLPLLKKAEDALTKCSESIQRFSIPQKVCHALHQVEAINSLESPTSSISIKAFLQAPKRQQKTEPIYDYLKALKMASTNLIDATFSKKQICKIHSIVKKSSSPKSELGRYRNRQNWIGPAGCTIDQAYFYPPAAETLETLMNQLLCYMNSKQQEPLLQLALIYAQFLILHPFMDGNGRVARILASLFLYKNKYLPAPLFFLSGYFKKHKLKYFRSLYRTTDENDWDEWICFFLKGIIQSAQKYTRVRSYISKNPETDLLPLLRILHVNQK